MAKSPARRPGIDPTVMYSSIRQEVLDQKKCQFSLFGACVTLTAAVLAYAGTGKATPVIYVAPMLLNVLGLTIILDKATSIQRMVGYLQLMESKPNRSGWKWEYHLNKFRGLRTGRAKSDAHRKHKYVRNVSLILFVLNAFAVALYGWGPTAIALRASEGYGEVREVYGAIHVGVVLINLFGVYIALKRWKQLVDGEFTSNAVRKKWLKVLKR
jgi:hypothetical protein